GSGNVTIAAATASGTILDDDACTVCCPREGLIACWKFDDATDLGYDSSGHGHHGLPVGVTPAGGTAYFDGNDYIEVPHSAELGIPNGGTMLYWYRYELPPLPYSTQMTTCVAANNQGFVHQTWNSWSRVYSAYFYFSQPGVTAL